MPNYSLKKVTGILGAQLLGKNSHPEGAAEPLRADELPWEHPFPSIKDVRTRLCFVS